MVGAAGGEGTQGLVPHLPDALGPAGLHFGKCVGQRLVAVAQLDGLEEGRGGPSGGGGGPGEGGEVEAGVQEVEWLAGPRGPVFVRLAALALVLLQTLQTLLLPRTLPVGWKAGGKWI